MKVKGLVSFRLKLLKPCRKLLKFFTFKLKKPVTIRALSFNEHKTRDRKSSRRNRRRGLLSFFCKLKKSKDMDQLGDLHSVSIPERESLVFPSPITPAYIKAARRRKASPQDDVDDACRSFENYLVDMIVDEGKVSDLVDIEELLYCWHNLRCPIFMGLVCRFYAELCKDLFAPDDESNGRANAR